MKPLSLVSSSAATKPVATVRAASYATPAVHTPTGGVGPSTASSFAAAASAAFSSMRAKSRGGGGGSIASNPAAKKSGDANAANTEVRAKNGAANVTAVDNAAKSVASNAGTGDASALAGAQEPVHGATEETGEEDWEGEGSVGPQVVKAFINYFSREVRKRMCREGVVLWWCSTNAMHTTAGGYAAKHVGIFFIVQHQRHPPLPRCQEVGLGMGPRLSEKHVTSVEKGSSVSN